MSGPRRRCGPRMLAAWWNCRHCLSCAGRDAKDKTACGLRAVRWTGLDWTVEPLMRCRSATRLTASSLLWVGRLRAWLQLAEHNSTATREQMRIEPGDRGGQPNLPRCASEMRCVALHRWTAQQIGQGPP